MRPKYDGQREEVGYGDAPTSDIADHKYVKVFISAVW